MGVMKEMLNIKQDNAYRKSELEDYLRANPHYHKYKNKNGYIMIPANPQTAPSPGYIPRYRLVYELFYGRAPRGWAIHHKNGIKTDDRPNNLVGLPIIEHNKLHRMNRMLPCLSLKKALTKVIPKRPRIRG